MTRETQLKTRRAAAAVLGGLCAAVAVVAVAWIGSSSGNKSPSESARSAPGSRLAAHVESDPIGTSPVTLNSEGITFSPSAASAAPANSITASRAYSTFEGPGEAMASGTSYSYGTLTWPVGDGTYRYKNRPVWAYRFAGCMSGSEPLAGNGATPTASAGPTSCSSWIFLDVTTGENLLTIQQQS